MQRCAGTRAAMSKAFRVLRNPKSKLNRLKDEYVPIFRHVGPKKFKHTQTSAVEWAVMKNEAREKRQNGW